MLTGLATGNREPAMELFFHKKDPKSYYPWLVNILEAGKYRFTLRQWPKEADKPNLASKRRLK